MLSRRGLIGSLISLAAAPAIVRASSLMPVKVLAPEPLVIVTAPEMYQQLLNERINAAYEIMRKNLTQNLYGDAGPIALKKIATTLAPPNTIYLLQERSVPFDLTKVFADGR